MQKRVNRFALLIGLMMPLLFLFTGIKGEAAETDVQIVIHKRVLRDADLPEFTPHQNDGNEATADADILSKTTSLDGAIFNVYDVSRLYHEGGLDKKTFLEQMNEMNGKYAVEFFHQQGIEPLYKDLKTNTEASDGGVLRFNVSSYNQALNKHAIYVIVETGVDPEAGVSVDLSQIVPLVVMLPVFDPITNQAMQTIHIYPKNVSYLRSPYFFKIGKKQDGSEEPLAGAVFVLYRLDEEGKKLYLNMNPATEMKNKWVSVSDPSADPTISRYTSDQEGLVEMNNHYLPTGTYYLEEIQGVEGYQKSEEAIPVVIPESSIDEEGKPQFVKINNQAMDEKENDTVPEAARAQKTPYVYNYEKKQILPDTKGPSQTSSASAVSKLLPQTGEQRAILLAVIGIFLVMLTLSKMKRRGRSN